MLFQEDENQTSTNQQKNNQHQHHCAKFNALAGLKKVIPRSIRNDVSKRFSPARTVTTGAS
jgi:hypothetical protein